MNIRSESMEQNAAQIGYCGWDIGGAHLKFAALDNAGRCLDVVELACPLWRGANYLSADIASLAQCFDWSHARHAVTMTGELCDNFASREDGVQVIVNTFLEQCVEQQTFVYGKAGRWYRPAECRANYREIASANWDATVQFLALHNENALVVDIGSTTTDIVPIYRNSSVARGYDDLSRLKEKELVYSGVIRTPIMALVDALPLYGECVPIMAEYFADIGDAYRVLGLLPETIDLQTTADGQAKTIYASAKRLLRMLGADFNHDYEEVKSMATFIVNVQQQQWKQAIETVLARAGLEGLDPPIIGLGAGSFVMAELAEKCGLSYRKFEDYVDAQQLPELAVGTCGPAYSVANLLSRNKIPS